MLASFVVIVFLLLLLGLAMFLGLFKSSSPGEGGVYSEKVPFMSAAEVSFFGVLRQAVGDRVAVMAKVRVADVIQPTVSRKSDASRWQQAFNRIRSKHFDYVLCSPEGTRCLAAIELDDKSHTEEPRRARDEMLDSAMRSAGIPLIRVPARSGYSVPRLRDLLESEITGFRFVGTEQTEISETGVETIKACPKCGAERVKRVGRKGALAGKTFWGCSRFPNCREIEEVAATPAREESGGDQSVSV